MTYCLGITTRHGLVLASDSRTNAGVDQVNVCRKMYTFEIPGQRTFVLLTSGSLSCTQSVMTMLEIDFAAGRGLAKVGSMYEAAREVGRQIRHIAELDRPTLERDHLSYNVHVIMGGQIARQPHELYVVYPQGNPLRATEDTPYLQIGETKYGRPILDRGIRYHETSLEEAAKYALISLDSTMRSNVSVGPPLDILVYSGADRAIRGRRRLNENDPDLLFIHQRWDQALRHALSDLPPLKLDEAPRPSKQ